MRRFEESGVGQRPDQHDGAGDRDGETEHDALRIGPAPERDDQSGHRGRDDDLQDRAGDRDPADGPQIVEREIEADPEHEEDHADLGELGGYRWVSAEPRCERADGDAGGEVPDQWRKPQPGGDEAAEEGRAERDRDREDQAVRRHRRGPPALESAARYGSLGREQRLTP